MGKIKISSAAKEAVILRSMMTCEDCKINKAEHFHHVTYARKGQELPEDLEHLCIVCHGKRHPHHNFRTAWEQRQIHLWKLAGAKKHKRRTKYKSFTSLSA